jgi:hypothetical protein
VRSAGFTASRSALNSASETVASTARLSASRAPLPSPNSAFVHHNNASGSQPSNDSRSSRFSGSPCFAAGGTRSAHAITLRSRKGTRASTAWAIVTRSQRWRLRLCSERTARSSSDCSAAGSANSRI